jgi:hypothetical protein
MRRKLPQRRRPRNFGGSESLKTIMPRALALLNILHRQAERATRRAFTPRASQRLDRLDQARVALREILVGEQLVP